MHDLPRTAAPLEAQRLTHPEVDRVLGPLLRSVHVQKTVSKGEVAGHRNLHIARADLNRCSPGIEPRLRLLPVSAVVRKRRSKIEDLRIRRIRSRDRG